MTKKHSTGALSDDQKKAQNARYEEGHEYDYVIIGTGHAALTAGALFAHAGKKICMLEAHDIPGGYAHSFKMGDYHFCAQVHYIWGCGPGGKICEFLKHIGLEKEITFELLDPKGYDHMVMPDGKCVAIPYGFDKLAEHIDEAYPGQKAAVQKFTSIIEDIRLELRNLPDRKLSWTEILLNMLNFKTLIKYRNKTVQDVYDQCGLSKESQAILIAQAGDFMLPPEKLSFLAYIGLFAGYNTGAYYPTKHFKYYIDRLAKFITDHDGCHIYYETEVTKINSDDDQITSVGTKDGKTFRAKTFICNMDPQKASHMMDRNRFSKRELKQLSYDYSASGIMIYLGLKDIDLRDYGLGNYNIWHLTQWDMNQMWKEQAHGNFENPWFFLSTPTLHSSEPGIAPEGGQILEIATFTEYDYLKELQDNDYLEYNRKKMELANRLIELVEEHHIPNLREHIAVKAIGSPVTNEDFCMATKGNAYGSVLTPKNISINRLKAQTPWKNFWWCNASSGFGGMHGTAHTGMQLYMDLSGDHFYKNEDIPTDNEFISSLPIEQKQEAEITPA